MSDSSSALAAQKLDHDDPRGRGIGAWLGFGAGTHSARLTLKVTLLDRSSRTSETIRYKGRVFAGNTVSSRCSFR
jgi:hypothetical protein